MSSKRDRFEKLLTSASNVLNDLGYDYAIIGGGGVLAWGHPMATKDVDFVIDVKDRRYAGVIGAFLAARYSLAPRKREEQARTAFRNGWWVRLFHRNGMWIDVTRVRDKVDAQIVRASARVEFYGVKVKVALPEDIVAYKLARFSDKDRAAIKSIVAAGAGKFSIRRLEVRSEQLAAIHGSAVRANLETVRAWHALARKGTLEF